MHTDINYVE